MGPHGAHGGSGSGVPDGPIVEVRAGVAADAPVAAHLHAIRIADGFLSFLGTGFLSRLYRRIARTEGSFLVVAEIDGVVAGFIAGTNDVGDLYRTFLVRDGITAGLAAAPRLLWGWRRAIETLRHGSGPGTGAGRGIELLAVAVDPGHEGRGVGRALVAAFLDRTRESGSTHAYVVVGADNAGAVRLYTSAGFVAGEQFELHAGTTSLLMQWERATTWTASGLALLSFAVTLVLTPLAIVVAHRTGVLDRPGDLKEQTRPVPYLGGVAVLAGVLVAVLADQPSLAVPLVAATAVGVADDRFDLPPLVRVAGEVAVGAAVVVTCPVHLPGVVGALGIVAVTLLLINGVNLMDGLDMLAGGTVAVAGVGFAVVLVGTARNLGVALAAALVAFLAFNRPPARIYLGDGGSYLLGTALAVLVSEAWNPYYGSVYGYAAFALVALPAAEVAFAVLRRGRGHRPILAGDRGHPYDRLVDRGWTRPSASAAYIAAQGVLTVGAVAAIRWGSLPLAVGVDGGGAIALTGAAGRVGALTPDQPDEAEPTDEPDPPEEEAAP